MLDNKNSNKIISIVLAIIVIISVITIVYVNLPRVEKKDIDEGLESQDDKQEPEMGIIFSLIYQEDVFNYTLDDLEGLEYHSSKARMIKVGALPDNIIIEGPFEFIGVRITTLLEEIENIPENYEIIVTSNDNINFKYNLSQIYGEVTIYNETGDIIAGKGAEMILAYKQDGKYITDEDYRPLRLIFANENITGSNIWARMVNSIEIIGQEK
jgi:hypothetical protein